MKTHVRFSVPGVDAPSAPPPAASAASVAGADPTPALPAEVAGNVEASRVARAFLAMHILAERSGSSRISNQFTKQLAKFTIWCKGAEGMAAPDWRIGEKGAELMRELQHGREFSHAAHAPDSQSTQRRLFELTRELKRHFRAQSAPGVVSDYAGQWAEHLARRVAGLDLLVVPSRGDEESEAPAPPPRHDSRPGADFTRNFGVAIAAGAGTAAVAVTTLLGKFTQTAKTDYNADDDGDLNVIRERRSLMSLLFKIGITGAVDGMLEGGGFYACGKFYEAGDLKSAIHAAIVDKINSGSWSSPSSGPALQLQRKYGAFKNTMFAALGMKGDPLADPRAPTHLTADKIAKGAMNQGTIQRLAMQLETAQHLDHAASDEFKELFPTFLQKLGGKRNFLITGDAPPAGLFNGWAYSKPAQVDNGNDMAPLWSTSSYGAAASAKFGITAATVAKAGGGLAYDYSRRELHLERPKKSHEFLNLTYAGDADHIHAVLDSIQTQSPASNFLDSLMKPVDAHAAMGAVLPSATVAVRQALTDLGYRAPAPGKAAERGEKASRAAAQAAPLESHRLSTRAASAYESRLRALVTYRDLNDHVAAIEAALQNFSARYYEFHELQDQALSTEPDAPRTPTARLMRPALHGHRARALNDSVQHRAFEAIDKMVFDEKYLGAQGSKGSKGGYGDGRHLLAAADDAFSVGLAAIAARYSALKERIGELDTQALTTALARKADADLLDRCAELSQKFANAGTWLCAAPSMMQPAQLLRHSSAAAFSSVRKRVHNVQLNGRATVDLLALANQEMANKQKLGPGNFSTLEPFAGELKGTYTRTRCDEHPNPFRHGDFIDLTLEVSGNCMGLATDAQRVARLLHKAAGKDGGEPQLGAAECKQVAQDLSLHLAGLRNRPMDRLTGDGGLQFSWRWHRPKSPVELAATDERSAPRGPGVAVPQRWSKQRVRYASFATERSNGKLPIGMVLATPASPVQLDLEVKRDARVTTPHIEEIGDDFSYQALRYAKPDDFDPKKGFTNTIPLLNAISANNENVLFRLTDYLGNPKVVLKTVGDFLDLQDLRRTQHPRELGQSAELINPQHLFQNDYYKRPIEAAARARQFDAFNKASPRTPVGSPYDIPQLITRQAYGRLMADDALLRQLKGKDPNERLKYYLVKEEPRKLLEQFLSVLHHHADIGNYIKNLQSFQVEPRHRDFTAPDARGPRGLPGIDLVDGPANALGISGTPPVSAQRRGPPGAQ